MWPPSTPKDECTLPWVKVLSQRSATVRKNSPVAISLLLLLGAIASCGRARLDSDSTIEILGTHYSTRLRLIYDQVVKLHGKPVEVVEVSGHVDNSIEVLPERIILRMHRGASEDNVAHELLHALFRAEGFPEPFAVRTSALSQRLHALIAADFDHLFINERLLDLGYDARKGFLSQADSFEAVLELSIPRDPSQRALALIGLLHELVKFRYYIGRTEAGPAILAKFPQVKPYWNELSARIQDIPARPSPTDLWRFVERYVEIIDRLANDLGAKFRPSDLIGFEPVFIANDQLGRQAGGLFRDRVDPIDADRSLVRTFTSRNILVWAVVTNNDFLGTLETHFSLPIEQFLEERKIRVRVVP